MFYMAVNEEKMNGLTGHGQVYWVENDLFHLTLWRYPGMKLRFQYLGTFLLQLLRGQLPEDGFKCNLISWPQYPLY